MTAIVRMNPEDRKAQLIDAAMRVAKRDGFQCMARFRVAQEAGITPGLIKRYFLDMDELSNAVARQAVRDGVSKVICEALLCGNVYVRRKVKADPALGSALSAFLLR